MIIEQRVIDNIVNSEISINLSPMMPLVALTVICIGYLISTHTYSAYTHLFKLAKSTIGRYNN